MATIIWTVFAVLAMVAIFVTCVVIVTVGTRLLEGMVAKRRLKSPG